ncbi:MAG: hypothetical protein FWB96_12570 [Defluviitaleaceae bacterium]|nr:hypothetical protein [Defluviitaleaceae bacterium]MCL2263959.1 hypothetical protein [Defluviitaleaceae bacterium]
MDLVDVVFKALGDITIEGITLPVTHITRPQSIPGVSYHFYNRRPSLYGDGIPIREEVYCQVTLWTKDANTKGIPAEIENRMRAHGFKSRPGDYDFEHHAGIYSESLVFYIEYEKGN